MIRSIHKLLLVFIFCFAFSFISCFTSAHSTQLQENQQISSKEAKKEALKAKKAAEKEKKKAELAKRKLARQLKAEKRKNEKEKAFQARVQLELDKKLKEKTKKETLGAKKEAEKEREKAELAKEKIAKRINAGKITAEKEKALQARVQLELDKKFKEKTKKEFEESLKAKKSAKAAMRSFEKLKTPVQAKVTTTIPLEVSPIETLPVISADSPKYILDESIRYIKLGDNKEFGLLREKRIRPKLDTYVSWDDNIYLTKDATQHDFVTHISPGVYAYCGNSRHALIGFYDADILLYALTPENNRVNQSIGARAYMFKASPLKLSVADTLRPTTYSPTSEITQFVSRVNNDFSTNLRYDMSPKTSMAFTYGNVIQNYLSSGFVEFSYVKHKFNPVLYWNISPKTSITTGYTYALTQYYEGRNYNSQFHQVRAGIEGKLTKKSNIFLKAGFQHRIYENSSIKNANSFVLEAIYDYRFSPKTNFELIASSNIDESVYGDVGYYRSLNFFATCTHNLRNDLDLILNTFYLRSDYPHETVTAHKGFRKRSDNIYGFSSKLAYKFKTWFNVYLQYEYKLRDSNFREFQYKNNKVSAGCKLSF